MKVIYEGSIGNYSFQMVDENMIEVWGGMDNERPESFIYVRDGSIKTKKDYQQALERLDVIFDAKRGTPEGDELEILGILIEQYEKYTADLFTKEKVKKGKK